MRGKAFRVVHAICVRELRSDSSGPHEVRPRGGENQVHGARGSPSNRATPAPPPHIISSYPKPLGLCRCRCHRSRTSLPPPLLVPSLAVTSALGRCHIPHAGPLLRHSLSGPSPRVCYDRIRRRRRVRTTLRPINRARRSPMKTTGFIA